MTDCTIPAGFLAAINAHPDDDAARLVAADWCAESGHSRGYGYGCDGSWWEAQLRQGPPPVGLVFFGHGHGHGHGDGDGDGDGDLTLGGRNVPEVGKNQLIVLPHGWVIVGFVAEQTGPYQFRVESARVVCRTGGVPWDELARGGRRELATYRDWGTVKIGPQFVMSTDWEGELPTVSA